MPGTLVITTLSDGSNSTSATNCIQGSAKAWVNFNGADGSRRASYNVSSVTRNGAGDYTVNFTNSLADANYASVLSFGNDSGSSGNGLFATRIDSQSTTSVRVKCGRPDNGALADGLISNVSIFR
jgi:hypothetical protein